MADQTDSATAPETHPEEPTFLDLWRRYKISVARCSLECEEAPDDDDDSVAVSVRQHTERRDAILAIIKDAEPPTDNEDIAALVGIASLIFGDYEHSAIGEDEAARIKLVLSKAYRGLQRSLWPPLGDSPNGLAMLELPIRNLAVLARVTASKACQLSPNHAKLSPPELGYEISELSDTLSLVAQVRDHAEALVTSFDDAWRSGR